MRNVNMVSLIPDDQNYCIFGLTCVGKGILGKLLLVGHSNGLGYFLSEFGVKLSTNSKWVRIVSVRIQSQAFNEFKFALDFLLKKKYVSGSLVTLGDNVYGRY